MKIIVTGGLGFIGSHFIELILEKTDWQIFCFDKETYAADLSFKDQYFNNPRVRFFKIDLANITQIVETLNETGLVDYIVHFAAESHVDNSIASPRPFVDTNVLGTFNMLEYALIYNKFSKFIHVSTDEVYGAINKDEPRDNFTETDMLNPSSVYSSTKASSDLIALSFFKTHGLPVCITRCCNNYGPRQNKEKFLPKVINNALNNSPIPVYGTGDNIREWIHVKDHCEGVLKVLSHGRNGEIYNIGTGHTLSNLSLVYRVLCLLNKDESLIKFVEDRKGHDFKYAINFNKIKKELNWQHKIKFNDGLASTIDFYKKKL